MASTDFAVRALAAADLEAAARLVDQAGWNQTAEDWRVFLDLGRGFAVEASGRLAATAATLPYPSGFGWISMVLVDTALRRRGIATRLLGTCIETLKRDGRVPLLDATPAGREVYRPLGFRDGWVIQRWRRSAGAPAPEADHGARALRDEDWPAALALDARAFGCDRAPLLARLRRRSGSFACVVERGGRLAGFLLGRDGRVASQLGPIVAEDEGSAVQLAAWADRRLPAPVIIDALERHGAFARWLESAGFQRERPYTRMALGREELFGDPARTFAIAGPELG